MAAGEEKLKLVLSAVDRVSAPIRRMNRQIESLTAPVRKVRNAFASLAREAGLQKLGARLAKLGAVARNLAAGAVAAGAALLAFVERTADGLDNLSEFTRLIGVDVEQFQEYRWAAKRAGIENETFAAGMKALAKNVGDAKAGTGRLAGLLKKVAPTTLKQIQATKSTGEALEVVLSAMRRLPDETRRNTVASKAFGNSQLALLATLSPDELKRFRDEARSLGIVLSSDAAQGAETLMDNIDALKASAYGFAQSIATALFPDMKRATDQLLEWVKANRDFIVSGGKEAVLEFARGMRELGVFLSENVPKLASFVADVGGIKTVLIAIAAISLAPLLQTILAIGVAMGPWYLTAMALVAAFSYIASHVDQVKSVLGMADNPLGFAPRAPAAPIRAADIAAQAATGAQQLDAAMKVNIELNDKRARVAQIISSDPRIQFGDLRGRVLGAQ